MKFGPLLGCRRERVGSVESVERTVTGEGEQPPNTEQSMPSEHGRTRSAGHLSAKRRINWKRPVRGGGVGFVRGVGGMALGMPTFLSPPWDPPCDAGDVVEPKPPEMVRAFRYDIHAWGW